MSGDEWSGVSVVSVTWTRPPEWLVVNQSAYAERRRRTLRWVDVHMGPVQWRVVDWDGYEAAMTLLRHAGGHVRLRMGGQLASG